MAELKELAEKAGISSFYIDKTGKRHDTTDKVRTFFLNAMGFKNKNQEETDKSYQELSKERELPYVEAFFDDEPVRVSVNGEGEYILTLTDEEGNVVYKSKVSGGENILLKELKTGYYTLKAQKGNETSESLLILAPKYCYQPDFIQNREHLYGVSLMMYALRSQKSLGIGDFGDLEEVVRLTAQNGGDVVGISPLGVMSPHTLPIPLFNMLKGDVSPYRTLSRLFVNYVYIDLRREPDFINSAEVRAFMENPEVAAEIRRLNESPNVIYTAALRLKLRLLNLMYRAFLDSGTKERKETFERFKQQKGDELLNLCLFEALLEEHPGQPFWRHWTDGACEICSKETGEFKQKHKDKIDFYAYCHWIADIQLKAVQQLATKLDMKVGLYGDMPIGAASNGAEVWENKEAYVLEAGVGAPADPMRPRGQSWGFTPYHPEALKKQRYAPFIRLVRENMASCGALRIDHAMGLKRLFWIFFTEDNPVVQGAYIHYDMKVMTAILSLESNRNKCLLIGEDLGTVPEGFREYMAEHGLLSYKVFFRQKEKDGSFITPEKYMYMSLAQSSTHDQATSNGFWANEDIEVFKQCGLYVTHEQYQQNLDGRKKDRENMIKAFENEKILSDAMKQEMLRSAEHGDAIPSGIEAPVNIFGAKTNSALYLVRLCDIYAQKELDNAPGTIDEYANWRLKLSHSIEAMKQTDAFATTMALIKKNRPQ